MPKTVTTFEPFRYRVFAVIWSATLISNIGTWMFNVTSGWMMTELSPSPLMVSLVQAATSLPIFLFALPAGALGDIFDRRKLLLTMQLLLALVLFIFGALLWQGINNAWLLLLFTFLVGTGTAFGNPAFQAIVSKLVPKDMLQQAVALNGVSINLARAVGPAIGGFILAVAGATATVMLDAASYLAVAAALIWWRVTTTRADTLPREHLVGAMQAGVRFALRSPALQHTIVRALAFFTFASAYWALLPLVAKHLLSGGPGLYGMLLTALGLGAVSGTFLLGGLKHRFHANKVVAIGTVGTAVALLLLAFTTQPAVAVLAGGIAGLSWIAVVPALNVSAQLSLPDWVRARGLAIYQMMLFGGLSCGSILWGHLAERYGLAVSLCSAAVGSLAFILITWRFKLNLGEALDHTPSNHWPEPVLLTQVAHDHGPVLVTIEYNIAESDRTNFIRLITEMGKIRRRDGAVQWGYFEDVEHPGQFIEMFTSVSWLDHLRQHARVSAADKVLQDSLNALHQGGQPKVVHAVMPQRSSRGRKLPLPKKHQD